MKTFLSCNRMITDTITRAIKRTIKSATKYSIALLFLITPPSLQAQQQTDALSAYDALPANSALSANDALPAYDAISANDAQSQILSADVYKRAETMLNASARQHTYRMSITPTWLENDRFWYIARTKEGFRTMLTDIRAEQNEEAFDHQALADTLSAKSEQTVDPGRLPLSGLTFQDDLSGFTFEFDGSRWTCSLPSLNCTRTGAAQKVIPNSIPSPDGRYTAYIKEHNLMVYDYKAGLEMPLTTDGEEHYGYGINNHGWWRSDTPILTWSPDSRRIATFRLDERGVEPMVLWEMQEGRPKADIWPYALPGDSVVPMLERVVLDVKELDVTFLNVAPDHQRTSNCCGLVRGDEWADIEWSRDGKKLGFVSTSRDYKDVSLRIADPTTGTVQEIYQDRDELFFESNLSSRGIPNWRILHESNEFIWFNRSDNWGHLYLHDLQTGELKNRITGGDWNVMDVLRVDEQARTVLFTAVGKDPNQNPYYEALYRTSLDGNSEPILLTPENADHSVSVSPDGRWIIDTYSDIQTPPITVLRNQKGAEVMVLEKAETDELFATGWRAPIPFTVKARDGETDLYGMMFLPSDFDSTRSYPIVNMIYPGPQSGSISTWSFSASRRGNTHALAELGFVVVKIDALGSGPKRSRDFHTAYAGNMIDNGLPDQITAMEQLAERHSFIDLSRAGIYGHSGGGFATAAALTLYPEFFKVGVAGAGNMDNRGYTYYWGEKYQGLLQHQTETSSGSMGSDNYTSSAVHNYAAGLQGKLLITYGSTDTNVHPNMTLLLIDALIANNKDFDLIVMPNRSHGYANEPYIIRRSWDYFVEHLAGKQPPKEYQMGSD